MSNILDREFNGWRAKLRACDAAARNDLYVHLNALFGMGHLLVRLWFVRLFRFWGPETFPAFASRETGFPDNVYSRAPANDATVRSSPGLDSDGACHE